MYGSEVILMKIPDQHNITVTHLYAYNKYTNQAQTCADSTREQITAQQALPSEVHEGTHHLKGQIGRVHPTFNSLSSTQHNTEKQVCKLHMVEKGDTGLTSGGGTGHCSRSPLSRSE